MEVSLIVILGLLYFLPTLVALLRSHMNFVGVFLLNLFLGWTFLGWLFALIWSAAAQAGHAPPPRSVGSHADHLAELERLSALKEKGALSEEEFLQMKSAVLKSVSAS